MKTTQSIQGKISGGFSGLGTVTPSMVEQRAREIALINGRLAEEFNAADFDEARDELTGASALDDPSEEEPALSAGTWRDTVPGSSGHKVKPELPTDDQRVVEQLVQAGVDEAEHDSMLVGARAETNQNS